MHAAVAMYP